jgi:hypothetical protein
MRSTATPGCQPATLPPRDATLALVIRASLSQPVRLVA